MDMPISILLLLCLIFFVIGIVAMILLQYYVYWKFSMLPEETDEQKHINVKYSLPLGMKQTARSLKSSTAQQASISTASATSALATASMPNSAVTAQDTESLMSLNFVMQFLFHELKNSNRVRKWFYRKLSLELDELIAKTTTGRLFDKLTIRELELGDQFPEIKMLRVHNVELDDNEGRIENLDLLMSLHYKGNFRTTIDADMVLGKKGSLTLKVRQLSGLARLQFTRNPYTHWSLSFLGDPELDLAIESKYQGRQMQSNITSLISNQIRKAVRRKHTLPNYKLRYKPFFHKTPDEDSGDVDIQPNGLLTVKVSELTRLMCAAHLTDVYCTLTMASLAFVEARQKDDRNVIVSLDVEIHKAKNQQIGIIFKQTSPESVEIETVLPNTPAIKSNLRAGDVVIAIEGKRCQTIQQIAKIVKALQSSIFSLRIERVIPGIIRNDAILEDLELYEDLGDLRAGYGGALKTTEFDLGQKVRQSSAEKGTSSESSLSSTPTNSPKKSKLIAKALKKTISRENSDSDKSKLKPDSKLSAKTLAKNNADGCNEVEHYYQHSTIDCPQSRFIQMEDLCNFKLDPHSRYLNVCVYGKCPGDSMLLGFVNVPINQILTECCETSLSQCLKIYELNPPITQDLKNHPLSNQSGFNANLCFGDILFSFMWDGNPNLATTDTPSKQLNKPKIKTPQLADDSGYSDSSSLKSSTASTDTASTPTLPQSRAHNFIRTHFQRATQCDYCGKKIWLKDAVQCRECSMCCHKKCITKCQLFTVCGPVDCSAAMTPVSSSSANNQAPEFTVTQADNLEISEAEEAINDEENVVESKTTTTAKASNLEVHRSSLTGLLAQGIKRVNSANNLAIPGIVSTLTGGGSSSSGSGNLTNAKSLPPSPQHSPSRKPSLVITPANPFETVTQRLEAISSELNALGAEQINSITEPIISVSKEEDVMTLAKESSKNLCADAVGMERVNQINLLLSKLRLALDSETAMHSALIALPAKSTAENNGSSASANRIADRSKLIGRSEERVQALSVIMLYLCTGLQHAQGVAQQ